MKHISISLKSLEGENAYVAEGSNSETLKISLQPLHSTGMPILDKNNCARRLGAIQKKPSLKRLYFEHIIAQLQERKSCAFALFWIVASEQRPDTNGCSQPLPSSRRSCPAEAPSPASPCAFSQILFSGLLLPPIILTSKPGVVISLKIKRSQN